MSWAWSTWLKSKRSSALVSRQAEDTWPNHEQFQKVLRKSKNRTPRSKEYQKVATNPVCINSWPVPLAVTTEEPNSSPKSLRTASGGKRLHRGDNHFELVPANLKPQTDIVSLSTTLETKILCPKALWLTAYVFLLLVEDNIGDTKVSQTKYIFIISVQKPLGKSTDRGKKYRKKTEVCVWFLMPCH